MGSGSSRMGSHPSRRSGVNRNKSLFAPLFCATTLSYNDAEMEDNQAIHSVGHHDPPADDNLERSMKESCLFSSENERSSLAEGSGVSGQCSNTDSQENSKEDTSENIETINARKGLCESKELVPSQENSSNGKAEPYGERTSDVASSSKELQSTESAITKADVRLASVSEVNDVTDEGGSVVCPEGLRGSNMAQQLAGQVHEDGSSSAANHTGEVSGVHNSSSSSVSSVSDSSASAHSFGDMPVRDAASSGFGFLLPSIQSDRRNGSVLHVDVVSISSNILPSRSGEISSREARRNSRRLFWDAFSRRSSRRFNDSSTIVFSTEDTDDLGSHDRWLLDFSGDLFDNEVRDGSRFLSRRHGPRERRQQSRSEIWERLRRDLDESSGHTAYCATGLHPDGTCSCEAFLMAEESSTRASISRIVMLAEALFEVLDEIHRQPVSLSLSMLSVPAPESVVDSFPLKSHKKPTVAKNGDDVEQCYICLAEYEDGDKIRVLPCQHEYHMSCVDKWLKEIHGVCPLCRGDVCQAAAGGSVSNT